MSYQFLLQQFMQIARRLESSPQFAASKFVVENV